MKSLRLLPLLLVLLATFASGETLGDQINAIRSQLNQAVAKRPELISATKALAQKKDDLEFGVAAFNKQSTSFEEQSNAWQQRADAYRAAVSQHNNNQCTAPADNPGVCSAYNAEAGRLNAQKAALTSEADGLDRTGALLNQLRQTITDETMKWAENVKRLNAEWDDNEANIQRLQEKLTQLQRQYETCRGSIPPDCQVRNVLNDKCEIMHATCGRIFDGNR